ncbi:MAG: response regulator transcription factor [Chitinophagaceae bacterium]|nr:response regulator transcription factor [Chitinophagaceae bacterium]MCB9045363.1 response regulator transcription factor [Chitinophagales bacterium]
MRTLLIDDEQQAISALKAEIIYHCKDLDIVGEARSVKEAVKQILALAPELIFLDIQLLDGTGFDILDAVKGHQVKVIFTTAFSQYAIKAIKFNALDYLLKPIDAEELVEAVKRAEAAAPQGVQLDVLKRQLDIIRMGDKKIVLKDSRSMYIIKVAEIVRCEAHGAYTDVFTLTEPKITISKSLKEFETMLEDYGFFRTHHSHLVNLHLVKKVDKADGGTLYMQDGTQIPISQRKWEQVIRLIADK